MKAESYIINKGDKPLLIDLKYIDDKTLKPIIIFCHGYKGFKDWGAWNIMAEQFAEMGFVFLKFNFSYNGGTTQEPIDFPDLEAFGNNNYTKELDDLELVINWLFTNSNITNEADLNNINLIGHSRGGGIVAIKAEEDHRIKKVITLASISDYKIRFPKDTAFKEWEKQGVYYVENGRTKQQMPHYFQFYTNFIENENRLTIQRAVSNLKIPHLIIHGSADTSVLIDEAHQLHNWNPSSTLEIIEGANHVFGASHPWLSNQIPKDLKQVINLVVSFINN